MFSITLKLHTQFIFAERYSGGLLVTSKAGPQGSHTSESFYRPRFVISGGHFKFQIHGLIAKRGLEPKFKKSATGRRIRKFSGNLTAHRRSDLPFSYSPEKSPSNFRNFGSQTSHWQTAY